MGASVSETLSNASRSNSDAYNIDPYRYAHIVDREGSMWLGDQSGVHRFSYSPLIRQEFPKAEAAPFFSLAPDEGGVVRISAQEMGTVCPAFTVWLIANPSCRGRKRARVTSPTGHG